MIELKPSAAALTRAVNLSPVNPSDEKGKFATDFYGKFDGESFRAAAKSVKFKHEAFTKTLAAPQNKFDSNVGSKREQFSLTNLTVQAARTANQTLANLTRSQAPTQASNLASNLTQRP